MARAEGEGEGDLARIEALARPGDAAGVVQLDQALGEHLGVDADVLDPALLQEGAHGIGHAADANLQARAVLDLAGDLRRHRPVDRARRRVGQLGGRRVIALDDVVDLVAVDVVAFAVAVRQARGRLDDQRPGPLDQRAMPGVGAAEIEMAGLVQGPGLDDDDVHRVDEAPVVVRHFAQIERDVVAEARVVLGPVVAAEMPVEAGVEAPPFRIRFKERPRLHREAEADADVAQFARPRRQRRVEHVRLAQRHPEIGATVPDLTEARPLPWR